MIISLSALVSSAMATEAEYGRCVKVAVKGSGTYANSKCTLTAGPKANAYEWLPGAEHGGFTVEVKSTPAPTLQIAEGPKIVCAGGHGTGLLIGPTSADIPQGGLTLEGCHVGSLPCQNSYLPSGTIQTREGLVDELVAVTQPKKEVGTRWRNAGAGDYEQFEFECPGDSELSSTFIANGEPTGVPKVGKMSTAGPVKYTQHRGLQVPEGGLRGCSSAFPTCAPVGVGMKLVRTYEEPIEIRPPL